MSDKETGKSSGHPVVLDLTSDQCVWAQAGVVSPRACINGFDCTSCSYDHLVQRILATGKHLARAGHPEQSWRDPARYDKAGFSERLCRHMLTGLVPVKYCPNNFDCAACPYDQMVDDVGLLPAGDEPAVEWIAGYAWAPGHYLSRGHTWARVDYGGRVRIGLDDFAVRLLGPPDELRLPALGSTLDQHQPRLHLERGEHAADLVCPVQGVVVAVNPDLEDRPRLVHESPYGAGWLLIIEPLKLRSNLKKLLLGDEARSWLEQEASRLAALTVDDSEMLLAATGGRAVDDIYGTLPHLGWDRLVTEFLTI